MSPYSREQLAYAHRVARLRGTLDQALADPTLARLLDIIAETLQAPAMPAPSPVAASPPPLDRPTGTPVATHPPHKPLAQRDFKRACAADKDDV